MSFFTPIASAAIWLVSVPGLAASNSSNLAYSSALPVTRGHTEVYSETNYLPAFGLLTDSRLRHSLAKDRFTLLYLGSAFQHQAETARGQDALYVTSVSPLFGAALYPMPQLGLFVEYRLRLTDRNGRTQSESDPRFGLTVGDLVRPAGPWFFEYYGEVIGVPRVAPVPVSTAWLKAGLRQSLIPGLFLDPFAEFFARQSRSPDLGRSTNEARAGLRLIYATEDFSSSVLVYESFRQREVQGLLVLWGRF